jgi:hypothetical protein
LSSRLSPGSRRATSKSVGRRTIDRRPLALEAP